MQTPQLEKLFNAITCLCSEEMRVIVLIGENGVGKSTFLAEFAERIAKTNADKKIIAISNTPHDKFRLPNPRIDYLGQRDGRAYASIAIKDSLRLPGNEIATRVKKIGDVLEQLNYERTIGLALTSFKEHDSLIDTDLLSEPLLSLLKKIRNTVTDSLEDGSKVIWVNLDDHSGSKTGASMVPRLLENEDVFLRSEAFSSVRVILQKKIIRNGSQVKVKIDLEHASSGEIGYLSSMAWAATKSKKNSVIIIDEPENSLHPQWQLNYIENLYHFFKYDSPFVLIATHSPILLSGNPLLEFDIISYRMKPDGTTERLELDEEGLEGVSCSGFNIAPRNNQHAAGLLIDTVNAFCKGHITKEDARKVIDDLEKISVDPEQKEMIKIYSATLGLIDEK